MIAAGSQTTREETTEGRFVICRGHWWPLSVQSKSKSWQVSIPVHVFFWRTFQFLDFVARCLLPCIDPSQQVSFKVSSPCIISASLQGSSRDEARVHRECFHFEMEAQTFATLCFGNEVVTKVPFFAPLPSEASEGHQVEPGSCHMLSQSVSQSNSTLLDFVLLSGTRRFDTAQHDAAISTWLASGCASLQKGA